MESGYSAEEVKEATQAFEPSLSVADYFNVTSNSHVIQCKGFSSFKALSTCLEEVKAKKEKKK